MLRSMLRRLDDDIRQCEARVQWQDARAAAQWQELHLAGRKRLKAVAMGGLFTAVSGFALRRYSRRKARSRPQGRAPWWHHLLGPAFLPLLASAAAPLVGRKGASFLSALGLPFHVQEPEPLELLADWDVRELRGLWYEVARIPPHPPREAASDVTLEWEWNEEDASLHMMERARRGDGTQSSTRYQGRVAAGALTAAQLELTAAPVWLQWWPGVWSDHWVLDASDDRAALLIGTPERDRLWILSRTPVLDETVYAAFLDRAARQGFDVQRLARTAHGAEALDRSYAEPEELVEPGLGRVPPPEAVASPPNVRPGL
ncbi:MAG TPA: lipocalin family protein [Burkholderiaceae bacterium]|nr:lipocalin family protein [Burkholderiaceae bacterium]